MPKEKIKRGVTSALKTADAVGDKVREKIAGYLLAGFGFVAGLAWNEAVKALIEAFWPLDDNGVMAKFVYAIAITFVVVIITTIFVRFTKKTEAADTKKK